MRYLYLIVASLLSTAEASPIITEAIVMKGGPGDIFYEANPLEYQYEATQSLHDTMDICIAIMKKELKLKRESEEVNEQ